MSEAQTEKKLKDISGMESAINHILRQAWERGYKWGKHEASNQKEYKISEDTMAKIRDERKHAQNEYEHSIDKCLAFLEAYWEGYIKIIDDIITMIECDNEGGNR